jgi:outer membrane protein OmpA-like peptidoglycan-associated protein
VLLATCERVNRRSLVARISPELAFAVALFASCLSCEGRQSRIPPRIFDEPEATATILFPKGESELTSHLPTAVNDLFERARSRPPATVLVLGFANEHDDLNTNLALAERRARTIAGELGAKGVPRDRIVVVGSEAPSNQENAARVEIVIVAASRLAMLERTPSTSH